MTEPLLDKDQDDELSRLRVRIAELESELGAVRSDLTEANERLDGHEAWQERALEASGMGAWRWDVLEDTVRWSPGVARLFGVTLEEFGGTYEAYEALVHPDDVNLVRSALGEIVESCADEYAIEHRINRPSGGMRWLEARGRMQRNPEGEPLVLSGSVLDITKRKHAERALLESEARLRAIFETTPAHIFSMDEGRRIRFANQLPAHMTMEMVLGTPADALLSGSDAEHFVAAFEEVMRSGKPQELEVSLEVPDGSAVHFFVCLGPIAGEIDGACVSGGAVEITDLVNAKAELFASQERLRLATQSAAMGVWDYDLINDRLYYDEQIIELLELEVEPGEVPRDLWETKTLPEDIPRVKEEMREAARNRTPLDTEYRVRLGDGELRFIRTYGQTLENSEGQAVRMIGVDQDITERRHLEEQLRQSQRMESIGRLAGGVAHDFNNLLTAVIGFSDLVRMQLSDRPDLLKSMEQISSAAERGAALTHQLLTFARKQVVQPRVSDLNSLILGAQDLLRRLIGEHIELRTDLADQLAPVTIDPVHFEQVLVNLAINARDAMPDGGTLTIASKLQETGPTPDRDGRWVLITVQDTGSGIPEGILATIFEPFFTTKAAGEGTGLGLATCFGIVSQSGGHIEATSRLGEGARFRVFLPACDSGSPSKIEVSRADEPDRGHEGILLVEDDPLVRSVVSASLEKSGYRLLEARDGLHALEVYAGRPHEIELLISDVVMPNLGGREVVEELLRRQPDLKVLLISGYATDSISPKALTRPGVRFLQKPFSPNLLSDTVRQILEAAQD